MKITYACPQEYAGSRFTVEIDGVRLNGIVEGTGSWTKFRDFVLGETTLIPGEHLLLVCAEEMPKGAVMNLQSIILEPVR